jgi:hypothetical protein
MNTPLTSDLVKFMLNRLVHEASWDVFGLGLDSIRVDVPVDHIGPIEIRATINLSFRTSDSNGGWTTEWIVWIPDPCRARLGEFRVALADDPCTDEMVDAMDLGGHLLRWEIESREA